MPQPQNYKNRTVHVRNSARAHLKELRQQRMAKRKASLGVARSAPALQDIVADAPDTVVAQSDDILENTETPPVLEATEAPIQTENAPETETIQLHEEVAGPQDEMMSSSEAHDVATDALDDLAIENAAMSEMTADVQLGDHSELAATGPVIEAPLAADEEPAQVQLPKTDVPLHEPFVEEGAEGDLAALPGAGPGLIWMLNQCGISSLSELAQADPVRLSKDMGIVGQILDVEKWIAFAASR